MNPYRLLPKILWIVFGTSVVAALMVATGASGLALFGQWWGVPLMWLIFAVGFVLMVALGGVLSTFAEWASHKWRIAEMNWDNRKDKD